MAVAIFTRTYSSQLNRLTTDKKSAKMLNSKNSNLKCASIWELSAGSRNPIGENLCKHWSTKNILLLADPRVLHFVDFMGILRNPFLFLLHYEKNHGANRVWPEQWWVWVNQWVRTIYKERRKFVWVSSEIYESDIPRAKAIGKSFTISLFLFGGIHINSIFINNLIK